MYEENLFTFLFFFKYMEITGIIFYALFFFVNMK